MRRRTLQPIYPDRYDSDLRSLLALDLSFPSEDDIDAVLDTYNHHEASWLWGCMEQKVLIGVIGVMRHSRETWQIVHLAVEPFYRKQGIGKSMIMALHEQSPDLKYLWGQARPEVVGFVKKCGFSITPIPSPLWEKEVFRCEWRR